MESAWQQCRVRCHWLADLTPITTNPLSVPLLFFFSSPRSHPIPYEFLLPFSLILLLSSFSHFLLPPSFMYLFVFDYYFPSLLCIFGNKHPGRFFLGFWTFGRNTSKVASLSYLYSAPLLWIRNTNIGAVFFLLFSSLTPPHVAYISRHPFSLPAFLAQSLGLLSC